MFLKETKALIAAALEQVFTANYPIADFDGIFVSIEYPMERQNYPAVWVGFEPMGTIDRAGIDNSFGYVQYGADGLPSVYSLWRANGYATFTIGAMTSLQRDRLFDEVLRAFAFNAEPQVHSFRTLIETNPLIALNLNFDNVAIRGISENPGAPWGTNEIVYEATLAIEGVLEFASDNNTQTLVPLSEVIVSGTDPVNQKTFQVTVETETDNWDSANWDQGTWQPTTTRGAVWDQTNWDDQTSGWQP